MNICQQDFEKRDLKVKVIDEKLREMHKKVQETPWDYDLKREELTLEDERKVIKYRVLGSISFIGELFLKNMLSSRIINTCVTTLLGEEAISNPEAFLQNE